MNVAFSQRNLTVGLYVFAALTVVLFCVGMKIGFPVLGALPIVALVVLWGFVNYKSLFFFLVAMLPLSVEYYFPNGLGTDLPTEPLMVGLMGITLLLLFTQYRKIPFEILKQPMFALLLVHLFWIFLCAINSEIPVHSFKVFASKLWYFLPFTVLPLFIIKSEIDIKKIFWCLYIPLTATVVITMLRHGIIYQFAFDEINNSVTPYFRNHVNYASMVSVFFPWLWLAQKWYAKPTFKYKLIQASKLLYIVAIYFSYTRAAMLAVIVMLPFYFVMKWNLVKPALLAVIAVSVLGVSYIMYDNYYLRYAPDYKKTIYHDDFGSHFASTFEGEDVSSMERVYRWVAAARMVPERPLMGVGSGNFFDFYKKYGLGSFETYISDNKEQSTVHNYFLLMLVEQGFIGLVIFVLLTYFIFVGGNKIYHEKRDSEKFTTLVLMQSMLAIYVCLLLNDMLESDKVGTFFFMIIGLLLAIKFSRISFSKSVE